MKVLEKDWKSKGNGFVVVFGRRRIGKSTLINEFIKNKDGLKYTAEDVNKKVQITQIKEIVSSYLKDDFLAKQNIDNWDSFFSYLSKVLDKNKRIYFWIDEFSYLIKNDSSLVSVIQKFNDDFLRHSNIFFIVSGSLLGLMSEHVLSSSSPLYGRRTRDLLLKPISPEYSKKFLRYKFEDFLKCYMTLNGIPEYLNIASKYKDYNDFVFNEFFTPEGYFYREPLYLLSQEFKEIKTYFSILNAIAYGNTKPSEIANFIGLNSREIYPYLELLINYGFIARETSVLGDSKKGVYKIIDNFFDFWFNFVHKNRENIEMRNFTIKNELFSSYFGKRFEFLIRENFAKFFKEFETFGRWWDKDNEIDILALNEDKSEILFAECKWKNNVNPLEFQD